MATFFAVCNANGPISKEINAASVAEAVEIFEAGNQREWIDEPATDAEDDLDICGDGMSESQFSEALEAAGCEMVSDLSSVTVGKGPTLRSAHVVGGWELWRKS